MAREPYEISGSKSSSGVIDSDKLRKLLRNPFGKNNLNNDEFSSGL